MKTFYQKMNRISISSALTSLMILATLGIALFQTPAAAHAGPDTCASQGGVWFYRWHYSLDFQGDTLNGWFEMTAKCQSTSATPIIYETNTQTLPLSCVGVGNLQIVNETAVFDGASHIECAMPDLATTFYDLTRFEVGLDPVANYDNFWMEATIAHPPLGPVKTNPIIYHDTRFTNPALHVGRSFRQKIHIGSALDKVVGLSQDFPFSKDRGWSVLRFEHNCSDAGCVVDYYGNGQHVGSETAPGSVNMATDTDTHLFFGFSPDYGTYFEGTLKSAYGDPGVFAIGG